jgi:hypothetical protein
MNKNTNFRFFIESSAKNIAHVIKKSSPNVLLTQSNRKLPEHHQVSPENSTHRFPYRLGAGRSRSIWAFSEIEGGRREGRVAVGRRVDTRDLGLKVTMFDASSITLKHVSRETSTHMAAR